jgi:hypothetical protein
MSTLSRTLVVLAGTIVLTLSGGPSTLTFAGGGGPRDDGAGASAPNALTRASASALAATGGGRVTDIDLGDERSYYEVEVTLGDGRQVDVRLDTSFTVVSLSADIEDPPGDSG